MAQKAVETSLIERFLYPKLGPGQMWEYVAKDVQEMGGEIHMNLNVVNLKVKDNKVESIDVRDSQTGEIKTFRGDYFFSTMAIKDLVRCHGTAATTRNASHQRRFDLSRFRHGRTFSQEAEVETGRKRSR